MKAIVDGKCSLYGRPKFCQQCCADERFQASLRVVTCPHGVCGMGLGDLISAVAKIPARALGMKCLSKDGSLKPESPCGKRKQRLNDLTPEWMRIKKSEP